MTITTLSLGERLTLTRRRKHLSGSAIARTLCVAPGTVSQWERGLRTPPLQVLRAWAEITGVSRDWLAFGDDDVIPPTDQDLVQAA